MDDLVTWLKAQLDEDEREIVQHPDDADYGMPSLCASEETGYPIAVALGPPANRESVAKARRRAGIAPGSAQRQLVKAETEVA